MLDKRQGLLMGALEAATGTPIVCIDVSPDDPEKHNRIALAERVCQSNPEQLKEVLSLMLTWGLPDPEGEEHSVADGLDSVRDMVSAVEMASPEQLDELFTLLGKFSGSDERSGLKMRGRYAKGT